MGGGERDSIMKVSKILIGRGVAMLIGLVERKGEFSISYVVSWCFEPIGKLHEFSTTTINKRRRRRRRKYTFFVLFWVFLYDAVI